MKNFVADDSWARSSQGNGHLTLFIYLFIYFIYFFFSAQNFSLLICIFIETLCQHVAANSTNFFFR